MSALTGDLSLTLAVQRSGVTGNILADELTLDDAGFDEQFSQYMEVADAVTDQAVSLGPLTTAQLVLILSDKTVSFKLNGSVTALACTSLLLTNAAVTAITVTNASGATASLRIVLLGT